MKQGWRYTTINAATSTSITLLLFVNLLILQSPIVFALPDSLPSNSFWLPISSPVSSSDSSDTTLWLTIGPKSLNDPNYGRGSSNQYWMRYQNVTKKAPILVLEGGRNYTFVDGANYAPNSSTLLLDIHPFYITDANSTGMGLGSHYASLKANGQPGRSITWSAPNVTSQIRLGYQCDHHGYMGGEIYIVPAGARWLNMSEPLVGSDPSNVDGVSNSSTSLIVACQTRNFELTLMDGCRMRWTTHTASGEPTSSSYQPAYISFEFTTSGIESGYRGYLGFGFGTTMVDTDLILMQLDDEGQPVIIDAYTFSFQPIYDHELGSKDDIFNIHSSYDDIQDAVTFNFDRLLDTGDRYDHRIQVDSNTPIIFARGSSSNIGISYHGLTSRGKGVVNFGSGSTTIFVGDSYNINLVHGVTMIGAWVGREHMLITPLFMYPLGGYVGRYLKHWNYWLSVHELCLKFGSLSAISFAGMAMLASKTPLSTSRHGMIGIAITIGLIIQIGLGEFSKWRIQTSWKAQWYHRPLAKCHKYIGFFLITFGPYQVFLGMDLLWPNNPLARNLYFTAIGLILIIFLTTESYQRYHAYTHRRTSQRIHNYSSHDSTSIGQQGGGVQQVHEGTKLLLSPEILRHLPSYTWEQLALRMKSGSKLFVIYDIVIDIKSYIDSHPGGRTILEDSIGTDVTRRFLGRHDGHMITNTNERGGGGGGGLGQDFSSSHHSFTDILHIHSPAAWKKLESMAIGKLIGEGEGEGEEDLPHTPETNRVTNKFNDTNRASSSLPKSNLTRLLIARRLPLKDPIGSAANYRTYRLISRQPANMKGDVCILRFDQTTHERPFVWDEYVTTPPSDEVTLGIGVGIDGESEQDVNEGVPPPRGNILQRAAHHIKQFAIGTQNSSSIDPPHHRRGSSRTSIVEVGSTSPPRHRNMSSLTTTTSTIASAITPDDGQLKSSFGLRERRRSLHERPFSDVRTRTKVHHLLPGEHVELSALIDTDHIERMYTPVPCFGSDDSFELIVKIYELGTMSSWLQQRRLGEFVKIRGPIGTPLLSKNLRGGQRRKDETYPFVAMIAGGVGITPFIGLIHHYIIANQQEEPHERSRLSLLSFNHTADDIIFGPQLSELARLSDGCLKVTHVLTSSETPVTWKGQRGRVNREMIETMLKELAPKETYPTRMEEANQVTEFVKTESFVHPSTGAIHPHSPSPPATMLLPNQLNNNEVQLDVKIDSQSNEPHSKATTTSPFNAMWSKPAPPSIIEPSASTHADDRLFTSAGGPGAAPADSRDSRRPSRSRTHATDDTSQPSSTPIPSLPRIYLCGPTDFLKSCLDILQQMEINMELVDCL